jgi:hypothetical protein
MPLEEKTSEVLPTVTERVQRNERIHFEKRLFPWRDVVRSQADDDHSGSGRDGPAGFDASLG